MKLEQKQFFRKRKFEIDNESLKIMSKDSSGVKEWVVNIENIGNEILIDKKSKIGAYLLGGFLISTSIFFLIVSYLQSDKPEVLNTIIFGSFSFFVGLSIVLFPIKNELHIIGGQSKISFLLEYPSRNEVEIYANQLIKKSKTIIVKKYSKIDIDLPEETMISQLNWLKNSGYISEVEYESKKQEYKNIKLLN